MPNWPAHSADRQQPPLVGQDRAYHLEDRDARRRPRRAALQEPDDLTATIPGAGDERLDLGSVKQVVKRLSVDG
jgi:hypothetical protein